MELNEKIVAKLENAFSDDGFTQYTIYEKGFRDALESFALALQGIIPEGLLLDGLETALDAYGNNVYDDEPEDHESWRDYDDGQPDELQEWQDFDPDC